MSRLERIELERLFRGDRVSIARAISLIENESDGSENLLREVFKKTGNSYRIGITGPPGAGKSTIANNLARHYRGNGLKVGIIAVDPTSPFTGGALLGDRVRMTDVELDSGVFIRSMATRGSLGGLSRKASEAADVLDAAGMDIVLIETVGVGQSELDIAGAADTTIVVLVPESGDSIQAMKAGLMEIADFFVLNKSDRAGADQAVMALRMILNFKKDSEWIPDVVQSVASEGSGTVDIIGAVAEHRTFMERGGVLQRKRRHRVEERIRELVSGKLRVDFWTEERVALLSKGADEVMRRELTPYDLAHKLMNNFRTL
jgi:LAO/AO transport system kinase